MRLAVTSAWRSTAALTSTIFVKSPLRVLTLLWPVQLSSTPLTTKKSLQKCTQNWRCPAHERLRAAVSGPVAQIDHVRSGWNTGRLGAGPGGWGKQAPAWAGGSSGWH